MRLPVRTIPRAAILLGAIIALAAGPGLHAEVSFSIGDESLVETAELSTAEPSCGCASGACAGEACAFACPCWTVAAEALILQRRGPTGPVLISNTVAPAKHLNAAEFDARCQGGVDVSLKRHFADDNALEVRYFGIDRWNAATATATTAGDLLQVNTALPVLTFAGSAIEARNSSDLHNVEVGAAPVG